MKVQGELSQPPPRCTALMIVSTMEDDSDVYGFAAGTPHWLAYRNISE